jgi:hypothetical protein
MALGGYAGEFGGSFVKMAWSDDGLMDGLNNGAKRLNDQVELILNRFAPEIENWMKSNASWTDQTGAARNGLAARYYNEQDSRGIILYHQVPYGIWLEVRFSGRYGIIVPAMEEWGPRVMEGMRGMMERIGR